jgi:hypothetical protein
MDKIGEADLSKSAPPTKAAAVADDGVDGADSEREGVEAVLRHGRADGYEGGHGEARGRGAGSARPGAGAARRRSGVARIRPHRRSATWVRRERRGGGGAGGVGVAAGGVVAFRANLCLTLFMKDLSLHACTAGRLSLHLQEVLERFEVRL